MGDHATAMSAAAGICAALFRKAKTGTGGSVHTSLVANGTFQLSWDYANLSWLDAVASSPVRANPSNPLNSYYRCADGKWLVLVNLQSDRAWPGLCEALLHNEWSDDPRFTTARERAKNAPALVTLLDEAFDGFQIDEIGRRLDTLDIIWAPVRTMRQALDSEEMVAGAAFRDCEIDDQERRIPPVPVDFDSGGTLGGHVPEVGEHTESILLSIGLSWEQISRAKSTGAVI